MEVTLNLPYNMDGIAINLPATACRTFPATYVCRSSWSEPVESETSEENGRVWYRRGSSKRCA